MAVIKNQNITSVGEDVEKLEARYVAGGKENSATTMESSLVVPQKMKQS